MSFHIVIPARYASSRLPGKPLVDIKGLPMIVRVVQQATASGATSVVVATDDERIVDAVKGAGFNAVMTAVHHLSGSSRALEVAEQQGWADDAIILNVQGDEPLIPPAVIEQVAAELARPTDEGQGRAVVTLCEPITSAQVLFDPNAVKVVFSKSKRALYFSRSPIPYARDEFELDSLSATDGHLDNSLVRSAFTSPSGLQDHTWWRHIGIYGYRKSALAQYMALPPSRYEALESLEQQRFLDNDIDVHVFPSCEPVPGGVDTLADLEAVRARF